MRFSGESTVYSDRLSCISLDSMTVKGEFDEKRVKMSIVIHRYYKIVKESKF